MREHYRHRSIFYNKKIPPFCGNRTTGLPVDITSIRRKIVIPHSRADYVYYYSKSALISKGADFFMKYTFSTRNRGTRQKPAWQLIISYEKDGQWKQKSKGGFSSRAEAMSETAKKELISKINVTTDKDLLNLTVSEFIDVYVKDKHISCSTHIVYKNAIKSIGIIKKMTK